MFLRKLLNVFVPLVSIKSKEFMIIEFKKLNILQLMVMKLIYTLKKLVYYALTVVKSFT